MLLAAVRPLLGALAIVVVAFASHAQVAGGPPIALTPEMVKNFVASYPDVKAKGEQLKAQYDVPGGLSGPEAWLAWAGVGGAKSQLDSLVGQFGFADFPTWVRTLSTIAQAYGFTQGGANLDSKMAEAMARIESDPNIPEAQKEMMRQQLKHSAAAIAAMKPPQANIDAVEPYAQQLGQLFEAEGTNQ